MNVLRFAAVMTLMSMSTLGCGGEQTVSETEYPVVGTVTANVLSSFGFDDSAVGVDLPTGLQVFIRDGSGGPVADAQVKLYTGASEASSDAMEPQTMAHQGGGRYEIDVLSGRLEEVAPHYYFEIVSQWLVPERVVLRVPHEALSQRPSIVSPTERSEHPSGQGLTVVWDEVPEADCYDVQTRLHDLMPWETQQECVTGTASMILAEAVYEFSSIRIRARHALGDEIFGLAPYFSYSTSDSQVGIRLTE